MTYVKLLVLLVSCLAVHDALRACFEETHWISYLFVDDLAQVVIPLLPQNCLTCQSADRVS